MDDVKKPEETTTAAKDGNKNCDCVMCRHNMWRQGRWGSSWGGGFLLLRLFLLIIILGIVFWAGIRVGEFKSGGFGYGDFHTRNHFYQYRYPGYPSGYPQPLPMMNSGGTGQPGSTTPPGMLRSQGTPPPTTSSSGQPNTQ